MFSMNDEANTKWRDTAAVIDAFGGIRPMAHKLDVPVSTVQGWKQRNAIPENRVADIVAAAAAHGVDLSGIAAPSDTAEETPAETAAPAAASATPEKTSPVAGPKSQITGAERQSGDRGTFFIAVIALIVALGAGGWLVLGGGQAVAPGPEIDRLTDRLEALEATAQDDPSARLQRQFSADIAEIRAEIDRLAEAQAKLAVPSAETDALANRLQAIERELGQVQNNVAREVQSATAALSAAQDEIEQLRQQLAAVGESRSTDDRNIASAVGFALAAGRLQRAMDAGEPYDGVLSELRTLVTDDAAVGALLDRLSAAADAGVPTRDALTVGFPAVARAVVAAAAGDAVSGWTDRTLQRIRNTVSVRRIGPDVPGDAAEARVARAEAKLLGGDLSGAVAELDGLEGAAAEAAAAWRAGARARLNAGAAADELEALASARLRAASNGP